LPASAPQGWSAARARLHSGAVAGLIMLLRR
jgi:hypothetical protein